MLTRDLPYSACRQNMRQQYYNQWSWKVWPLGWPLGDVSRLVQVSRNDSQEEEMAHDLIMRLIVPLLLKGGVSICVSARQLESFVAIESVLRCAGSIV